MKVGFNAHLLSYRHWYRSAGISRYIDHTLGAMAPYAGRDQFAAFVGPDVPMDVPSLKWLDLVRSRVPTQRPFARIAWEQVVLPLIARRLRLDLLHSPAYVAPLVGGTRGVVTFHDLSFFVLPHTFNRSNRQYLQKFSRLTAGRADRFIAVSQFTRDELVRLLGVPRGRINVVYNGVEGRFRPSDPAAVESFRKENGLPDRFILYLGTLEPRKNVGALIRAYAHARHRGVTEPLVIAGGRGWGNLGLERLVAELDIEHAVRWAGFTSMEDQPLWYNAAALFAYPSLYEGFGLPVLEAMACGTPVLVSDRASLPEVVGDAGVLVDPDKIDALGDAMFSLLNDDDRRADLAERGIVRARSFTWDAAARATLATYRQTLGQT